MLKDLAINACNDHGRPRIDSIDHNQNAAMQVGTVVDSGLLIHVCSLILMCRPSDCNCKLYYQKESISSSRQAGSATAKLFQILKKQKTLLLTRVCRSERRSIVYLPNLYRSSLAAIYSSSCNLAPVRNHIFLLYLYSSLTVIWYQIHDHRFSFPAHNANRSNSTQTDTDRSLPDLAVGVEGNLPCLSDKLALRSLPLSRTHTHRDRSSCMQADFFN